MILWKHSISLPQNIQPAPYNQTCFWPSKQGQSHPTETDAKSMKNVKNIRGGFQRHKRHIAHSFLKSVGVEYQDPIQTFQNLILKSTAEVGCNLATVTVFCFSINSHPFFYAALPPIDF